MPYLKSDIKSNCKRGYIYGVQGEVVGIVSRSGNMYIVEDKLGERYSVHQDELVEELPVITESKQDLIIQTVAAKKTRKAAIIQTPSLF